MSFNSLDISATGLYAQRLQMDAISSNIANINTTRDENGNINPYKRKVVTFSSLYNEAKKGPVMPSQSVSPQYDYSTGGMVMKGYVSFDSPMISDGVSVSEISDDKNPYKTVYDPSHPDADENGFVKLPNVNVVNEMVDMMMASRAYEANVSSIEAAKSMITNAMKIGQ